MSRENVPKDDLRGAMRRSNLKHLWICFFLLFFSVFSVAECSSFPDSLKIDALKFSKSEVKPFRMKKSPWLAVLQSAVLPGLGQFYNQSYWKIPVILGLTAYLGYEIYDNTKTYHDYRDQYANSQTVNPPDGDLNLKALRNFYRDQRDEFIWYFAIVYVVNLVDAYVDSHLFDFDVREDKPIRFGFNPSNKTLNFNVTF